MKTASNESLAVTALLVFFGVLALYRGGRWLPLLIPAALLVWLVAGARCQSRRAATHPQVENRMKVVGR
jgi:hypothetical protein